MMGRGEASGEKRVLIAAETAISNPLIEDPSIKRASGLLISITGLINLDFADVRAVPAPPSDDSLEGIVRVSVVATGIDNTSVMRQPQAGEGALTNLAEKLRHGSRHIADRSQQDSSFRPMPITPSLLALPQAGPLMASAASNTPAHRACPASMSCPCRRRAKFAPPSKRKARMVIPTSVVRA
jgi:cell division protein FtsZ